MFKKTHHKASTSSTTNAYQRGYNRAVKDYQALKPFRHYPQKALALTSRFIKGKIRAARDYVDGYEDAKQQLS